MHFLHSSRNLALLALGAGWVAGGCSSGSGASSSGSDVQFAIESISVLQGQEWKINRPIDIRFSKEVDFSTVNMNTIRISDTLGNAATGVFSQPKKPATDIVDKNVVRFQPNCPTEDDFSDAGFLPGTQYRIAVFGSGGNTVHSTDGDSLQQGTLVDFQTPAGDNPLTLFIDTVPGPPAIRLRGVSGVSSTDENATAAEIGGQLVYFTLVSQQGRLPAGFKVPLNHYSIAENRVSVILQFNQPVSPKSDNISSDLLAFEYLDGGTWKEMQTLVDLIANCTETGAAVRVTPLGILPQGAELRMNMRLGFADLTGDQTTANITNFARMDSAQEGDENPLFEDVTNPAADELLEGFVLAGDEPGSLEDTQAGFAVPLAHWGNGHLDASFDFSGTGGPGGNFDWMVPEGADVILNTLSDTIVGGEDFIPETSQAVINGVVDVRNFWVPETSTLIIQGPNPCTILASGWVKVEGEISVRGTDSPGVIQFNNTSTPEEGAPGQAGGGDGGDGSYLTNQSTPRGGRGNGAFNAANGGGQGGETSYANTGKNDRRGSGGGGGRFGPDIMYDFNGELALCHTLVGLDAEPGAPGGPGGLGAESQSERAQGGEIGPGPFVDESSSNDFYGRMLTASGEVVLGELPRVWGGSGGGGGGDAVNSDSFPLVPWNPQGDEKGCGGGGGGGGLRILAVGPIDVGRDDGLAGIPGSIAVDGGDGGAGENTNYFDRVGGGSGGGSAGHLVLSSADKIVVWGIAQNSAGWYRDDPIQSTHRARPLSALGGQGGAGNQSWGGANENGPTTWLCDAVPNSHLINNNQPPKSGGTGCYQAFPDKNDPSGFPVTGAGGDGGPGIIQLHVEDPATDLPFPDVLDFGILNYEQGMDVTPACAPPPLGWKAPGEAPDLMIPFFGRRSAAQTKWIPLGLARAAVGGTQSVTLRFEGTDAAGDIPHDGSLVEQLPPILGPDDLGTVGNPPFLSDAGFTMVFDASGLAGADDVYKENTQLLRDFSVKLEDSANADNYHLFSIASATYESGTDRLSVHIDASEDPMSSFGAAGQIEVSLVPHFVRVVTSGLLDQYPEETAIRILFDATVIDPVNGGPSETLSYSAINGSLTPDIDDLNDAQFWDFVRVQMLFDLSTSGDPVNLTSPRPGLDLARFAFRF